MSNSTSEIVRYNRIRQTAIVKLGGQCVVCGSKENLEFDHIDRTTKEYAVSDIWSMPNLFWLEVAKCQLLCNTCHKVKTKSESYTVPHGGGVSGKHECKCIPCRAKKREYNNSRIRKYRFS